MMPIAEQDDRADQALACARARLLHGIGGLEPGLVGSGVALLLEHAWPGDSSRMRRRVASRASGEPDRSGGVAAGTLRQSVLEHAAHGVEGAEDDDSISGVRGGQRRGERLARARVRSRRSPAWPFAPTRAEARGELARRSPRAPPAGR